MPDTHGTYDDGNPEEIRKVKEDAVAQYRLQEFVEVVVQCELSLVIAMALENDDLDHE